MTDAGMGSTQSISSVVENCPSTRETRVTRLTGTELPHPGYSTNSPPSLPDLILHQEHMQPSVLLRSLVCDKPVGFDQLSALQDSDTQAGTPP